MDEDPVLQTGEQAAPDPMQAVQSALAYGRQKLGLPAKFYPEEGDQSAQSFDDGGMVDDDFGQDQGVLPSGQPQGGGQPGPDPRATLHYLTGAGAVSGEVASALEQQADPDGTMDPAERALRTLSSVSDDKTRFGLLQHYRSKFNAYTAGAKVALTGSQTRPADLGQAAQAATQAFAHLPLGRSIQFAPTAKGIAVMSKSVGSQTPQPSFDDGGEVEDSGDDGGGGDWGGGGDTGAGTWGGEGSDPGTGEQGAGDRLPPAEGEDKDRLVSMGGENVARKDNVEDRRDQHGEGVVWKNDRKVAPTADEGGREFARPAPKPADEGVISKQKGRAGMLGMQKSFDDGGEVDDEDQGDVTAAVTPGSGEGENVPDEVPPEQNKFRSMMGDAIGMRGRQAQVDTQTKGAAGWAGEGEPVVLSLDQFKKMLDGGYDKPLESGWDKFIGGIMSAVGPEEASAADATPGADTSGDQWTPVKAVKDKLKGLFSGGDDTAAALAADPDTAPEAPQVPTPQPRPARADQSMAPKGNSFAQRFPQQARALAPRPNPQSQGRLDEWRQANPGADDPNPESPAAGLIKRGQSAVAQKGFGAGETFPKRTDEPDRSWRSPYGPPDPGKRQPLPGEEPPTDDLEKKITAQADRLYPQPAQRGQRAAYIAHMMEKEGEHKSKLDVAKETWGARGEIAKQTEAGRNQRAEGSRQGKMDVARLAAQTKMTTAAAHELASTLRTNILASGDMASSVQKQLDYLGPYAQRFGVDPRDLYDAIQSLGQPGQSGGAAPQARPQSQVGNPGAGRAGEERPYTVKGVTKTYVFGTDGLWHKKPEGQAR